MMIDNLSVTIQSKLIFDSVNLKIVKGKHYALIGPSGSGKTTLLKCIAGECFFKGEVKTAPGMAIVFVEQQHHFKNLSNTSAFYYQQRFNSMDADDSLLVEEYLPSPGLSALINEVYDLLEVYKLFGKRLIQLSNGENKKVQLAHVLLQKPDVLLLDNPFLGLDRNARVQLNKLLQEIADWGITIILASPASTLPGFITDVLEFTENNKLILSGKNDFLQNHTTNFPFITLDRDLLKNLSPAIETGFEFAIRMKNTGVRYSENQILEHIDWDVKKGERWSLSGPNGSGKSTLLSLINADNPQAYANEIYLFDKRRGRGESIWDIKKKIGFVSPELHLYFDITITVFAVVASGLFDTIGLFRQLNEEQEVIINNWIKLLELEELSGKLLCNLSLGKQRLVLLARALVKNPPLLILDEPAQGLDEEQTNLLKSIIEQICDHSDKTLIYVTHLKEEIPSCVTKFIELENGRIKVSSIDLRNMIKP